MKWLAFGNRAGPGPDRCRWRSLDGSTYAWCNRVRTIPWRRSTGSEVGSWPGRRCTCRGDRSPCRWRTHLWTGNGGRCTADCTGTGPQWPVPARCSLRYTPILELIKWVENDHQEVKPSCWMWSSWFYLVRCRRRRSSRRCRWRPIRWLGGAAGWCSHDIRSLWEGSLRELTPCHECKTLDNKRWPQFHRRWQSIFIDYRSLKLEISFTIHSQFIQTDFIRADPSTVV